MSSFGTGIAGLIGGVVVMMGLFAFAQRRWVAGLAWLLGGMALIALLTYLDKPGSDSLKLGKMQETRPLADSFQPASSRPKVLSVQAPRADETANRASPVHDRG